MVTIQTKSGQGQKLGSVLMVRVKSQIVEATQSQEQGKEPL
jgi:hypothetical protein